MSLQRQQSLCKRAEFAYVFSKAKKINGHYFTILYRNNSLPHARLGLVVSKKHSKNAVRRNLLRRLIKLSFASSIKDLPAVDIIVISKPSLRGAESLQIRQKTPLELLPKWQFLQRQFKQKCHQNVCQTK